MNNQSKGVSLAIGTKNSVPKFEELQSPKKGLSLIKNDEAEKIQNETPKDETVLTFEKFLLCDQETNCQKCRGDFMFRQRVVKLVGQDFICPKGKKIWIK